MISGDWSHIDPGVAPGGMVFRLTAGGEVWEEHAATPGSRALLDAWARADGIEAAELAKQYGEARLFVYDGDTGACVLTMVVAAMTDASHIADSGPVIEPDVVWERCEGCGYEYRYPHLCRTHMLCGLCHPPICVGCRPPPIGRSGT